MPDVLYLSRTGMLEPLGHTQVLSYLGGLSDRYSITLISFEREADLKDQALLLDTERFCKKHGIEWIRHRYRNRPRWLAGAWNLLTLFGTVCREVLLKRPDFIHARSYLPAMAAWIAFKLTATPYLFDLRSLWPEELITSGRAKRDSWAYRQIVRMEGLMLRDAAAVVSVTKAAIDWLDAKHFRKLDKRHAYVIPGSADLERFRVSDAVADGPLLIGCHGSITTGWFRADLLGRAFAEIARRHPDASYEIITRSDPETVMNALRGVGEFSDRLRIYSSPAAQIHNILKRHDLSIFFYASGAASELGRSPVRMGESLGCGLPILTNGEIGDVAEIIAEHHVGAVIDDESEEALSKAVDQVLSMVRHPTIAERCRSSAELLYSLEGGIKAYDAIYQDVLGGLHEN